MKLFLIILFFLTINGDIFSQEKKTEKTVTNAKSINIRSNSRQQAMVKRDNFHQRRDIRALQMKRMMKVSKQHRKNGKNAVLKKGDFKKHPRTMNKKQLMQKRAQQEKMKKLKRQRAMRKKR